MRRPICNGKPATAPRIYGHTFFLCWRCTGGVVGLAMFLIIEKMLFNNNMKTVMILLSIPAIIDYYLNKYKMKEPSNKWRFFTGILLGISVGCFETLILDFLC